MSIATTLKQFMADQGVSYGVVTHSRTEDAMRTAAAAHVSGEILAKAVVLKDDRGYLVAIMPATYKVRMGPVHELTGRSHLEMVDENELAGLFMDCERGAVPAVPAAYGLDAVWDDSLAQAETIYFEGGDHRSLIHVTGDDFRQLMGAAEHGVLGAHV